MQLAKQIRLPLIAAMIALLAQSTFGLAIPQTLSQWKGEYFTDKEGGFYFKASLKGGIAEAYDFTVHVYSPLRKKTYAFVQTVDEINGPPAEVWKIPTGKYRIKMVSVSDSSGNRRFYRPKKMKSFSVKRHSISNLGLWVLVPLAKKLIVKFKKKKNQFKEKLSKGKSSVAFVVNGFNGLIEAKIGGKRLLKKGGKKVSDGDARIVVRSVEQIGMFYGLNLFKHNHFAQKMMAVLEGDDAKMRECYTDRIAVKSGIRGDLKFRFILSKLSKGMKGLKRSGGSISDPKLVECVYYRLGGLTFPVNTNMIGEVTYQFDVKK